MDTRKKEQLVSAWIQHFSKEEAENEEATAWAHNLFSDICQKHPNLAWSLIIETLHRSTSELATSALAAGPMEDLLAYHGASIVEKVEQQARKDSAFKDLLGGVWPKRIAEPVWKRVEAVRGEVW